KLCQGIELRVEVFYFFLPVDFGDGDATQRVDVHQSVIVPALEKFAIELQVFADGPAAGEESEGPLDFILILKLSIGPGRRFDNAPIVSFLCLTGFVCLMAEPR